MLGDAPQATAVHLVDARRELVDSLLSVLRLVETEVFDRETSHDWCRSAPNQRAGSTRPSLTRQLIWLG